TAWHVPLLLAADAQLRVRQSDLNLRSRHSGQFHTNSYGVLSLAHINRRRPRARLRRSIRQRSLLQRREQSSNAVTKALKFQTLKTCDGSNFHKTVTSDK